MEDFSLDLSNILSDDQLNELNSPQTTGEPLTQKNMEENKNVIDTENLTAEDLFGSESVGKQDNNNKTGTEKKDTTAENNQSTPQNNLYSSIAKAFQTDGIFDFSDEEINKVRTSDDFAEAIEKKIQSQFDERQKRIDAALNNGVEPDKVKIFENNIAILNNIKDEDIEDEGEQGIALRRNLIIRDYLNRGFSQEKAVSMAQRSFDSNNDIEDAKEALQQNKNFFKSEYSKLLDEAETTAAKIREERKKAAENLKKSILEESKAFGELTVDTKTRQKIFDTISKPVYKDPNTGTYLTELQKYERDNHNDFMKNLGYLYVVTDGFKTLGNLTNTIKKEVTRKGLKDLENVINTTSRNADGSLKLVTGKDDDSYFSGGWTLDLK